MKAFNCYLFMSRCVMVVTFCPFLQGCNLDSTARYSAPPDTARIALPTSQGIENGYQGFKSLGYQKGETVPDLTLYALNGHPVTLYKVLQEHKPLLLVSGSYTCDASRHNLPSLNKLARAYKDKVAIYMVYIIDAHPRDTISPYSLRQEKWLSTANTREHVEADQPRTYGQRKALAAKWQHQYKISPPVLVDSPDNAFWINFGQAPNMVYLIEPNGTVRFKEEWYRPKDVETALANTFHTE